MCRGLPFEGLGVAPTGARAKAAAQQVVGSARPRQFDDAFLQYTYKVVPCDKNYRHDYATCPFSHPGESSERRHPSAYLPFMCGSTQHSTDLKEKCPFGTACKYAHGHFELWLHPGRFRTKMCSLGENCRRAVCFFAHSQQELRVTPYSKLDTAATTAAEQLAQMQREGSLCPSLEANSNANSTCSSSDADELKAIASALSSACGSELAFNLPQHGSPCSSVAPGDEFAGLTAGMVLSNQAAMLEIQLQSNALALAAAADANAVVAGTAAVSAPSAPDLWLARSTGMLQQQMPVNAGLGTFGLLPQQPHQLVVLDASNQLLRYDPATLQASAALPAANEVWTVPNNKLADQWTANAMLAQQRQSAFNRLSAGMTAPTPIQCLAAPGMASTPGLDQWLQMDNTYGAPPGLNRAPMGCGMYQQQHPAATARVAQLLSTLPDQTVQQLLGMLTVEPQA